MNFLKRIPITYLGELHDIVLVNFYVDIHEVRDQVPDALQIKNFGGSALFSMVNVQLKDMRMKRFPMLTFSYQHIGLRLLVEDRAYHGGDRDQGIFFYQSFTDRPLVIAGGALMTDYRLDGAALNNQISGLQLRYQGKTISYQLDLTDSNPPQDQELLATVGAIDRAYAVRSNQIYTTQIMREKWPLEAISCTHFYTDFFKTAKLAGVFRVPEVIYYQWLAPRMLTPTTTTHEHTHIRS